jgi:hypothetical protein
VAFEGLEIDVRGSWLLSKCLKTLRHTFALASNAVEVTHCLR